MPTLIEKGKLIQPEQPDRVPVDYIMEHIFGSLAQAPNSQNPFLNRLLILEAKTASGKSITIPAHCAINASTNPAMMRKTVLCTQPRILTTQEIPRELHESPYFGGFKFRLGENLGFQTGPLEQKPVGGGLLFATLGVLEAHLQMLPAEQICRRYAIIIIDEAHERQLIFDNVIMMLKAFYRDNAHRTDLPYLILMSATFDVAKYAAFFGVPDAAPSVMKVGGATYPIDTWWPTESAPNYFEAAVAVVWRLVDREIEYVRGELANGSIKRPDQRTPIISDNRILFFLPGQGEAKKMEKLLAKTKLTAKPGLVRNGARVWLDTAYVDSKSVKSVSKDFLKISGAEEAQNSFDFTLHIDFIMTNAVAETGLSLPNLLAVIDCGWSREAEFNPVANINTMLVTKPAAQSQITQRRGRGGRKKAGIFAPLYTEATFNKLLHIQMPEILKLDPTNLLLCLATLRGRIGTPAELAELLLDVPTQPACVYAINKLQLTGMIDQAYGVTALGRIASKMVNTLSVDSLAAVFAGFVWDASIDDLIAICVMMKWRFGPAAYMGFREEKRDELAKRGKFDELTRREPNNRERTKLYGSLFGGADGNAEHRSYALKALLADDFIEQLLIFRLFEERFLELQVKGLKPSVLYATLTVWADECFINLPALLDAYNDYTNTKSALCLAGLDIEHGRHQNFMVALRDALSSADGILAGGARLTDFVTRLKLCLNQGFAMNRATLDPAKGDYVMDYGIDGQQTRFTWSFFGTDPGWKKYEAPFTYQPKRILFYSADVLSKKGIYSMRVNGISVLDGYV